MKNGVILIWLICGALSAAELFTLERSEPERPYYAGRVYPAHSVGVSFPVTGRLVEVAPAKSLAYGSVYDKDGNILEPGTILARQNNDRAKLSVERARDNVQHCRIILADRKCTLDRELPLAKRNAVSAKSLQNAQNLYDIALSNLTQAEKDLALAEETLDACTIPASFSGIVSRVLRARDASVAYSANAMIFQALSPLKIVVEVPPHVLKKLDASVQVMIYPGGREKPVPAWPDSLDISSGKLECLVDNPLLPSQLTEEERKLPQISGLSFIPAPEVRREAGIVWIAPEALRTEQDTRFVWKFEKTKDMSSQTPQSRIGVMRKVAVRQFDRYIFHGDIRLCAVESRDLACGDILVTGAVPSINNGDFAVYAPGRRLFHVNQHIAVRFSESFSEDGFYVPPQAIFASQDRCSFYVRLFRDGKLFKQPVSAEPLGDWTLIDACELEPGMQIALSNESNP